MVFLFTEKKSIENCIVFIDDVATGGKRISKVFGIIILFRFI
jgi:hypothetical protein